MGDYERDTRGCTMLDMDGGLATAIRAEIERHELGGVEAAALACGETHSKRVKRGGFFGTLLGGQPKVTDHGWLITPEWLFLAVRSDRAREATVMAFRLRDLEALDFARSEMAALTADTGVELTGAPLGSVDRVGMFAPLGEGPDGDHLKRVLFEAVRAAGGVAPTSG